jgi:multiple sugar transport system permease protein
LTVSSEEAPAGLSGRGAQALRPAATLRRVAGPYAFVLPGFALFALVVLYPIANAFRISLFHWSIVPGTASDFIGLDNYVHAVHDPLFWRSLQNTLVYMAVSVPGQLLCGLGAALLLDGRIPARGLFRTLYYLPVVTSWVVVSLLFRYLFTTDGGVVNWLLDGTHLMHHHIDWLGHRWTAMLAISIVGVWKGVGWSMVIFLAALQSVPRELHEAAAVDGAGWWSRFRAVTLPALRPVVAFVTVMLVIGSFNVFISVFVMTNGGPLDETQVLLTYMYRQAFSFLDFGYGAAISFLLTTTVFVLSIVQLRLFRRPKQARA